DLAGDFPLLFLKAQFDESECKIQLTDLNRLWGVTYSRNEVLQSAKRQGTSIDPSEDDAQFGQYVSKVGSALAGERETTVTLEPAATGDALNL
nr:hypothetical protein [Tanacetum cinerariifolium]